MDLVADEGADRRTRARIAAFGVNGVGVALILLVFSQTGGLVGAEVGVAGGTAVLAQRVRKRRSAASRGKLAKIAKQSHSRVEALMAREAARFHSILDQVAVDPETATRIRAAVEVVEASRAEQLEALGLRAARTESDQPAIEAPSVPAAVDLTRVDAPDAEVVDGEVVDPSGGDGTAG
jgi:hypothetical protein